MVFNSNSVVVGSGLVAKSFANVCFLKNTLILASGVSNSNEFRVAEYAREVALVRREIKKHIDSTVIYFSTCSLESGTVTPYTKHKIQVEEIIANEAKSFHIFRLPQVVGVVRNSTLVSCLVNSILESKGVDVQQNARRNLLDVVDVARITNYLVDREFGVNSVQNIASAASVSVIDIVKEISIILELDPEINYVDSGYGQIVDVSFLMKALGNSDAIFASDYWQKVLRKYVPLFSLIK